MKIIWSDFASETLKDIFQYHKKVVGKNIAQKLKDKIFQSTKQLIKHPNSGQTEESLAELNEGHRYLVSGNYKVVYKKVTEGILITDIFDTRQNPIKINVTKRKPSR
jgi:plasmid stabilization system protein ParE